MAESQKPKYDSLPGIDTAPDVYETPDLAEDVSTIQASTIAVSDSDSDTHSDPETSAVRNQRFHTEQARNRFQPSRVSAQGVDFSDNISAQRRSYRTSTRTQRRRGEVLGNDSESEEEEGFEARLARVRQEVAELESEYERRVQAGETSKIEERDPKEIIDFISDKVDAVYAMRSGGVQGTEPQFERTIEKFNGYAPFAPSARITKAISNQPPLPGSQVQRNQLEYVLHQAAEFDARVTQLEKSLGLSGSTMPDLADDAPFPVFTTLERIEQTVGLVGDATSGNLEAAISQIQKLAAEAQTLKDSRGDAAAAKPSTDATVNNITAEQEAKVNALYGTLPAIDKLAPVLPLVLDRLRTLRLVHTSAWQADELLTELEKRLGKQEAEIGKWREVLEEVEGEVGRSEGSLRGNMKKVDEWVKRIEMNVKKLPGVV